MHELCASDDNIKIDWPRTLTSLHFACIGTVCLSDHLFSILYFTNENRKRENSSYVQNKNTNLIREMSVRGRGASGVLSTLSPSETVLDLVSPILKIISLHLLLPRKAVARRRNHTSYGGIRHKECAV